MSRYWIGVASYDHVKAGVAGGFAQLGHGKHALVQKLQPGDWIIYYSPRSTITGGEPVRAFTAIGKVKPRDVYQVEQSRGFRPSRRDVNYRRSACSATIADLLVQLSFTRDKGAHWGMAFRRGSFEISLEDFVLIAAAMKVRSKK